MSQQINILFLDDMETRHNAFMNAFGHGDWKIWPVFTAKEAISLLDRVEFAQAFLDHDLSIEDIMCPPGGPSKVPTGMDVVDHIVKMESPVPWVICHTHNEPAAHEMLARLAPVVLTARWIPFRTIIESTRK